MEDFWKSVQTIQAERGADYRAFSLFSATHWAELLGAAAVIFLCAVIYYRCREVTRHQILRAVFVLMLADEFMKQAVLLYTGQWNVTYLPLHLCSINIFVCWYDAIHQSRWSKEILYALCIPGAVVAMLSPSWQRLPVWNLLHLHSYSIHVLLILYPVLLLAGGFRPQVHHIRWVLAFLCAIATPIFFLNRLLKTNFFFLNDPQGNAITAFFAHCFGERFYLLGFLPVLAAVLLLLYLPWYRAERHQRKLLKTFPEEIQKQKTRIAALQQDSQIAAAHPQDKENFCGMTIKGMVYDDKKAAGERLLLARQEMPNADMMLLGTYRGFELNIRFDSFKNEHQAVLRAELSYPVSLGDDARGNITRLDNAIDNFADRIADAENALQNLEQQKQAAEVEVAKPFAQEEELAEKSARLAELNALLNIDRDRSSSQDAPEETEETETPATRPSVLAALGEKTNQPEPVKPFRSYYDKDGDAR